MCAFADAGGKPIREMVNEESGGVDQADEARGAAVATARIDRRHQRRLDVLQLFIDVRQQWLATYPPSFRALVILVCIAAVAWVINYLTNVLPTIEEHGDGVCKYNDSELTYNAKMLFVYFVWFSLARMSLFFPCVAVRVTRQSRTHGFCRTYCIHLLIRDGPLYIFVVGSVLFWFHLVQSPSCEDGNPKLYQTLKLYAMYSCMVSVLCFFLAYRHNKFLIEASQETQSTTEDRAAPSGTIEALETLTYDAAIFGDEEGKLYPAECAICLCTWEVGDVIKVTHCKHAFHLECLGTWLQSARTCALCRQDLTKPTRSPSRTEPPPETIGFGPRVEV